MRFSILIPVYNAEKYLSACVNSILPQISPEDEIILFSEHGWGKRIPQLDFEPQNRGGKGVRCFYFNKNGSNGRAVAGLAQVQQRSETSLLITQAKSPASQLRKNEILLQNRQGKGMPYVMAIMDDIVTDIQCLPAPPEAPSEA